MRDLINKVPNESDAWDLIEKRASETPDGLFGLDESGATMSFSEYRDAALKAHTAHEKELDTKDMLADLQVPVLIACGRQDMNLAEAQRIAASIPGADCHIMEMTGHGSPFFRPGLFVQLVTGFAIAED